jgi:hypothetical protein
MAVLATIKLGNMEQTISASQAPLTPNTLKLYSAVTPTYYGAFFASKANYISAVLQAAFEQAGFGITTTDDADTWNVTVPADAALLYSIYNNYPYSWKTTNDYRARSTENWSMIHGQENGSQNALNANNALPDGSPLYHVGHGPFAYNANVSSYTANSANTTKVMQYLLKKSPKIYLEGTTTAFWQDGISTYINLENLGSTAVPITISATGNSCTAFIDIKNRIFWMGETEHWGEFSARTEGGNRREFIQNVADFMAKAVGYGTNFTDLLLEESDVTADDRAAGMIPMPAPWDDYWNDTANGGTDNRLMPVNP